MRLVDTYPPEDENEYGGGGGGYEYGDDGKEVR